MGSIAHPAGQPEAEMTIERKARTQLPARTRPAACLDCPDCAGTCWEAVAMRLIPETVLHSREPRP